jgi:hypothetical protein
MTFPHLLIIGGHQRSGTTLLNKLCNFHPDMRMTMEFRMFAALNTPYTDYIGSLRRDWFKRPIVMLRETHSRKRQLLASAWFLAQYQTRLLPYHFRGQVIDAEAIRQALAAIFPGKRIVGDKYPRYYNNLDELAHIPDCYRVFIYRDGRDVVASWYARFGARGAKMTLAEVAGRWVRVVEAMERNADYVHIIRYEALVTQPRPVMSALADYLGVDVEGFKLNQIHESSIGKHRQTLTAAQLAEVMTVAEPTLKRLGYLE